MPDAAPIAATAAARWATRDLWLLAAISAVAAAARLWQIEQWSWCDREAATWQALTQPLGGAAGGLAQGGQGWFPLVYLMERALLSAGLLPSYGEGWLRLPFAFVGAVMVPCVAVLARRRFGRGAALLAAVALAVHPSHIAASQTADPVLVGVAFALLAGAAAQRGVKRLAWGLVIIAGLCHAVGLLLGMALLVALAPAGSLLAGVRVRLEALSPWWWVGGTMLLLPWAGVTWLALRGPVVVLAVLAAVVLPSARVLGAVVAASCAVGGVCGWFFPGAVAHALVAVLPLAVVLSATMAIWLANRLGAAVPVATMARAVGAVAALVLVGELMTGAFLYFMAQSGGRPPWRDLQRAALATQRPGAGLQVVTGSGFAPLQVYLRPNHWRGDDYDPHPGTRVDRLADPASRRAQLEPPGVVLALEQAELDEMRRDPELVVLLGEFVEHRVFPCPQPGGDRSLHLLWRRAVD